MADENKVESVENAAHKAARPLKYVRDEEGNGWLCDQNVDPTKDLRAQGCWRCEDMAFPAGGR